MQPKNYDEYEFNITTQKVIEFLTTKTTYERRPHFENNKLLLGGVYFWFSGTRLSDGTLTDMKLSFDVPPRVWNFKAIRDAVDMQERTMFINMGVQIEPY